MGSFLIISAIVLIIIVLIGIARLIYCDRSDECECEHTYNASGGIDILPKETDFYEIGSYTWAVKQLEEGKKVRRKWWVTMRTGNSDVYIEYVTRNLLEKKDVVKFCRGTSEEFIPYMAFSLDVRANDWELVA